MLRPKPILPDVTSVEFLTRLFHMVKAKQLPPVWVSGSRFSIWFWEGEGDPAENTPANVQGVESVWISHEDIVALVEGSLTYNDWREKRQPPKKKGPQWTGAISSKASRRYSA